LEPVTGTHYLVADDPLGPFRFTGDEFLVGDTIGSLYAGKLAPGVEDEWVFLAFRMFAPDGSFVGELSDPFPVMIDRAGNLSVNLPGVSQAQPKDREQVGN
jgi:beta-fructofuranosidase